MMRDGTELHTIDLPTFSVHDSSESPARWLPTQGEHFASLGLLHYQDHASNHKYPF